jgi:hypothetical protein
MSHLEEGFPLRCFQRLSLPNVATQQLPLARQLVNQRFVHIGPLVLEAEPLKHPTLVADCSIQAVCFFEEATSLTEFLIFRD